MRRPRLVLRLVPLAAALAGAAGLGACRHEAPEGLPPGTTLADLPDGEAWAVRLRQTRDGQPTLDIDAPYLARYERPDSSFVFLGPAPDASGAPGAASPDSARVRVRLYGGGGQAGATVEAGRAWFYPSEGRLVAEGRVRAEVASGNGATVEAPRVTARTSGAFTATGGARVALAGATAARVAAQTVAGAAGRYTASGGVTIDTAGRRLTAGRVVFDEAGGRLSAPGAFAFTGPRERVRGVGLSAATDLSRYSFRNLTGEIEVQE